MPDQKLYKLLSPDGSFYLSDQRGLFGGHRGGRGYGRMDCRAALRAIAKGGYVRHRVFFADEATAIAAGYRPCAACLPDRYALWKLACAQADVPRLVRSRVRRQPALEIYRYLLNAGARHDDEEITRRLDEVYAQEPATIDPVIARLAARSLPKESG